jgi:hypothetical protein
VGKFEDKERIDAAVCTFRGLFPILEAEPFLISIPSQVVAILSAAIVFPPIATIFLSAVTLNRGQDRNHLRRDGDKEWL